ncbi:unnamed protein product [Echinostoma caproni]|uniref:Secreted protein n=1 Tax=Echinostoma caproni TaxID=27848 RepID=A0A183AKU3_9TREM|nr:unnamed protein product [Echinostoma caproni]
MVCAVLGADVASRLERTPGAACASDDVVVEAVVVDAVDDDVVVDPSVVDDAVVDDTALTSTAVDDEKEFPVAVAHMV